MSTKNSNDTIGNQSRDLPVCSAVPQPLRQIVPLLQKVSRWIHCISLGLCCQWLLNETLSSINYIRNTEQTSVIWYLKLHWFFTFYWVLIWTNILVRITQTSLLHCWNDKLVWKATLLYHLQRLIRNINTMTIRRRNFSARHNLVD
jgi:hypothetical protein